MSAKDFGSIDRKVWVTLTRIQEYYRGVPKPERFGNPDHCDECTEHNETLLAHDVETISLVELGNPGWDPICFIDAIDQFRYYLPALARLACGTGDEDYLDQVLFHLNADRIQELEPEERRMLAEFLEELVDRMADEIENCRDTDPLLERVTRLRQADDV